VAWVTIREAAARLGVSQDTVKRRLKRGELVGHREPRPQGHTWLIELPDETAQPTAPPPPEADAPAEVGVLREMVGLLREQLANRERDIRELHVLLDQAQRALPPPPRESGPSPGQAPDEAPEHASEHAPVRVPRWRPRAWVLAGLVFAMVLLALVASIVLRPN
jgi:excisionase family DNA binding protein